MSFRAIIGHNGPIGLITSAIERERLPNAYLFSGEDSIGKRLVATTFAKAVNCLEEGLRPCNSCPSCRMIEGGTHPDISIVVPDGTQIKIAQIRSLQEKMVYKPYKGRRRVYIIDEADKMNLEASNSFLKTLEEPMGDTTIILITSSPNSLPATLLSRCEQIRFVPPPSELIAGLLVKDRGMKYDEALILSMISMGKVGIALSAEQGELIEERDKIINLIPKLLEEGASGIFEASRELSGIPGDMDKSICWLMVILRDILVFRESKDPSMIFNRDRIENIESMGRGVSSSGIIKLINQIWDAERLVSRNINRQLTLDLLFISIRDQFRSEGIGRY
ncbi:MAG TPA: DNA polymerase III subunit delta' [Nitrospiria bacterium]|nr:DNA polymerase III subunit delta' [Nitrospiria bacterium]